MSIDLEKKEQYLRDSKAEEDRIRDMKKSIDYKIAKNLSVLSVCLVQVLKNRFVVSQATDS